jgi:hypothetical protein
MKLYRYQPINQKTLSSIVKEKNWVSDPFDFNDPFEFRFTEINNANKQNELVYLEEENRMVTHEYIKIVSNYGVVSYSLAELNILLYSHYADKHRGMCLEFEVTNFNGTNLKEVKYCTDFKRITFPFDEPQQKEEIEMILTTKSEEWKYEKEYRQIIDHKKDYAEYPGKLVGIIFGCQAKRDDIDLVIKLMNFKNSEIEFSKAFIFPNSYKLGISTATKAEDGAIRIPESW